MLFTHFAIPLSPTLCEAGRTMNTGSAAMRRLVMRSKRDKEKKDGHEKTEEEKKEENHEKEYVEEKDKEDEDFCKTEKIPFNF